MSEPFTAGAHAGRGGSALPTYEYACRSCETHLEVVQRFDDEPLAQCPACGGQLRKVFGSIGISFKGSGFYKTDSRSLEKAGAGASSKASESGGDASGPSSSGDGATSATADGGSAGGGDTGSSKDSKGAASPGASTSTAKSA